MYIYFVYYIIFALISTFSKQKNLTQSNGRMPHYVWLISISLILLAGLRSTNIGIDTGQYKAIWDFDIKAGNYHAIDTEAEYGYFFLQTFFKQFMSYQSFLFVVAILSIVPTCFIIYRYSSFLGLSFLLFYASIPFHALEFSAARQAIAFGLVMISYHYFIKRELFFYSLFLIAAILFHQTAIIFVPCYCLFNVRINKKSISIWFVLLAVSFVFAKMFFSFFNSYSRIDYSFSEVEAGGQRLFILLILFVILGFVNKDIINESPNVRIPFILFSISPLLWPILNGNPALYRLQYYFDFFFCLYVPNLLMTFKRNEKMKYIYIVLSIFISLYIVLVMRNVEAYYPYKFFWE